MLPQHSQQLHAGLATLPLVCSQPDLILPPQQEIFSHCKINAKNQKDISFLYTLSADARPTAKAQAQHRHARPSALLQVLTPALDSCY